MPTGYTAPIEDGDTSAKSFATRCARAFGAFSHQREESMETPPSLPTVRIDSYYEKGLIDADERLQKLLAMTPEEIQAAWETEVKEIAEISRRSKALYEEEVAKYQAVKDGIDAWEPNEEAGPLKAYCLEQLRISWPYEFRPIEPPASAVDWYDLRIQWATRDIHYYEEHIRDEVKRLMEAREYAEKMLASIEDIDDSPK